MNKEELQEALQKTENSDLENKYLTFFTEHQLFGIPIVDVEQIVSLPEITRVPEYPAYMKGVIDLRGQIIPLIDVRLRFGKEEKEYDDRTCVIVANIRSRLFGFIVDEVDEVTDVDPGKISPPPKLSEDGANRYLTGIARLGEKIVLLLDASRILSEQEFSAVAQAAGEAVH